MNARSPARARHAVTLALTAALALAGSHAHADKQACAAAYERAQDLRRKGRLLDAREALIACSQPSCPAAAVADCGPWLAEVEQSLPSVVIAARDMRGRDRLDVRVLVDGRLVAPALDGKAVPVDPGTHTFRYEPAGGPAIEERVLIREGEKNRRLTVTLGAPPAGDHALAPHAERRASPAEGRSPDAPASSVPALVWVFGGAGVAGLAVFAAAGAMSLGAEADLRASCAPRCAAGDVNAIRVQHAVADVGLGVGVLSLGAAAWLYVTRPAAAAPPKGRSAAPRPVVRPFLAGAAAGLEGTF
ncbi:uncharacterized protein SOCE26_061050 [Sorangium cellulosum]|uniref:PEGA domain-containing protein n=1 Tax=Sorangium cellulosum TaxID=56 RepID=A0A2L0EZH3_SORCE|nr:hypothetical protein [Sorangium cellulosum]AUX44639.1 uncharacterized protein SOCE26_061050 [Sorangium cellulosum]